MDRKARGELFDKIPKTVAEHPVCASRKSLRVVASMMHRMITKDPDYWWSDFQERHMSTFRVFLVNSGFTPDKLVSEPLDTDQRKMLAVCIFEVAVMGDDFYDRSF